MRFFLLLAGLALAASPAAQSYTVTPAANATKVGTASNTYPLYFQAGRYQQLHGDLKGTPRIMTALSLRKGGYTSSSAGAARTLTCTLLVSNTNFGLPSTTFSANYDGTPVTAMPRGTVNLPSWSTSQGTPEPWTVHFPFATPYPHPGQKDFLWELQIHASTSSVPYFADTVGDSTLTSGAALGSGCISGGQTNNHRLTGYLSTATHDNSLRLIPNSSYGPATAAIALLAGTVNPNLTVPGLCETLFVVPLWTFSGVTTATGSWLPGPVAVVTHDASWVGVPLYAQLAALDASQSGIPLSMSNGRSIPVPPMNTASPAPLYRIWNASSDVAATGSTDSLWGGYGLITRVTH
jgi:hypothetical protein